MFWWQKAQEDPLTPPFLCWPVSSFLTTRAVWDWKSWYLLLLWYQETFGYQRIGCITMNKTVCSWRTFSNFIDLKGKCKLPRADVPDWPWQTPTAGLWKISFATSELVSLYFSLFQIKINKIKTNWLQNISVASCYNCTTSNILFRPREIENVGNLLCCRCK